jgi:hypothetical protein
VLAWQFDRALTDVEMDNLLSGVRAVQDDAQRSGHSLQIGLTVKPDNRTVEFWVKDQPERKMGKVLLAQAIRKGGIGVPTPRWVDGYDFELLFKGTDY